MSPSIPGDTPQATPKDKYHQLKDEFYRLRDEYRQSCATIENYERELKRRAMELNKGNHYINHLQHESQRSKDTINDLQNELIQVKADKLSISEVGEKVTALNEEIFQAAATLGEALIHKRYEVSQKDFEEAAAVSQEMVGEELTNILIAQSQKPKPEVNLLLVEIVLQIFMVNFCVSKIQSWYPGDPAIGGFLSGIYSEIRLAGKHHTQAVRNQVLRDMQYFLEEQPVSGRWRALTRAHTRPSIETWNRELYKELQSVLIMASWAPRSPENEECYKNRLPSIFKAVNELHIIGENFTSADLDIFVFDCDKIYNPAIMENVYGDGRRSGGKQASEAIVGTTGIGLGKVKVERGAKDVIQMHTLIPAKVVLWSFVNKAFGLSMQKKPVDNMDGANQDGRE